MQEMITNAWGKSGNRMSEKIIDADKSLSVQGTMFLLHVEEIVFDVCFVMG